MTDDRRLIEDFLPINALNAIAGKEKKHPKHLVSLIHYWPARRPITASRAAIYAALVPAPSNDTEREQSRDFVEQLAAFNPDSETITEARAQILANHGGTPPKVLDLFAGGGAIPLEAARLGCVSHANDYSPVAHLIELCTLVYPQRYGAALADDVERWGKRLLSGVKAETGDLYPDVSIPADHQIMQQMQLFAASQSTKSGKEPVTYIWVRTVPCRKPGCEAVVPLVRQAWLRKKGGYVAAVPRISQDGKRLEWSIASGSTAAAVGAESEEQTGAGEACCLNCPTPVSSSYVKECAVNGSLGEELAAVVIDGGRSKIYLPPSATNGYDEASCKLRLEELLTSAAIPPLDEEMNTKDSTTVAGRGYGIDRWSQLFTSRQLLVLFSLVKNIRQANLEMVEGGMEVERAKAVTTYLSMAFGRLANSFTKFCRWQGQDQKTIAAIGDRQALKMVYDFSEINPFAETAGCLPFAIENEAFCIRQLAKVGPECSVVRGSAERLPYEDGTFDAVVTDPPYYSSIYYADLSAFFYVWLRRIVGDLYPEHFVLPSPPKRREAVAQPSEHSGDAEKAELHYRELMERSFAEARRVLKPGAPLVCVYAHKTAEGWASLIKVTCPVNSGHSKLK